MRATVGHVKKNTQSNYLFNSTKIFGVCNLLIKFSKRLFNVKCISLPVRVRSWGTKQLHL